MVFAVFLSRVPDRELTREAILRHVEHLKALDAAGQLVLCGPFTDHPSGLVVVHAENKAEAEALALKDPFVAEGFRTFELRTWQLANAENGFLA